MRKIRTAKIGKLVYVPVSCFAPLRSGWNGWIFRCGTIEEILTGKNGEKGVKVRFCSNAEPYMVYNFDSWKTYKEVPRFVKEYARYKVLKVTDNECLSSEYADKAIGNIFEAVKKLEYGYISIDECVSVIETTAFNVERRDD